MIISYIYIHTWYHIYHHHKPTWTKHPNVSVPEKNITIASSDVEALGHHFVVGLNLRALRDWTRCWTASIWNTKCWSRWTLKPLRNIGKIDHFMINRTRFLNWNNNNHNNNNNNNNNNHNNVCKITTDMRYIISIFDFLDLYSRSVCIFFPPHPGVAAVERPSATTPSCPNATRRSARARSIWARAFRGHTQRSFRPCCKKCTQKKITSLRVIPTVTLYWNIFVTNSDIFSALRSLDFIRIILSSSSLLLVRGPAVTTVIYQAKLIQTDPRYAWFKTISDGRASPDAEASGDA